MRILDRWLSIFNTQLSNAAWAFHLHRFLVITALTVSLTACTPKPQEQNSSASKSSGQIAARDSEFVMRGIVKKVISEQHILEVELPYETPPRNVEVRTEDASILWGMGVPIVNIQVLNKLKFLAARPGQEVQLTAQATGDAPLRFEQGKYVLRRKHILGPRKGETEETVVNGALVNFSLHPDDTSLPDANSPLKPVCDGLGWFIRAENLIAQHKDIDSVLRELSPVPEMPEQFLMLKAIPDDIALAAQFADSLKIPADALKGLAQNRVPLMTAQQHLGRALAVVLLQRRGSNVERALPGMLLTMADTNQQGYGQMAVFKFKGIHPILDCLAHLPPETVHKAFEQCEPTLNSKVGMRQLILECEGSDSQSVKEFGEKLKLLIPQ